MKTLIVVLLAQSFFIGLLGLVALFINAHDERVRALAAEARSTAKRVVHRGREAFARSPKRVQARVRGARTA